MRQRTWFEMPTFVRHNYNGLARQTDGRWFGLHRSEPWASRRQANEVAERMVESGHTNVESPTTTARCHAKNSARRRVRNSTTCSPRNQATRSSSTYRAPD